LYSLYSAVVGDHVTGEAVGDHVGDGVGEHVVGGIEYRLNAPSLPNVSNKVATHGCVHRSDAPYIIAEVRLCPVKHCAVFSTPKYGAQLAVANATHVGSEKYV